MPQVKETPLPQWSFGSFDPVARQQTFLADSQDNTAYAFFGEASYDVTDRLEASFALRYDNDERENTTETPNIFIPTLIQGIAFQGQLRKETWDDLQPKVTLRFQPNDDWTLYGGYSRGFRSGGFNQTGVGFAGGFGGTGVPGIADLFDQETANTIEVGVKGRFLQNRMSLGISAYSTEAKGTYYFVFDPGASTQNLGNLAEVDYEGLEAEIQARAAEGLDLYAASAGPAARSRNPRAIRPTSAIRRPWFRNTPSTWACNTAGFSRRRPLRAVPHRFADPGPDLLVSGQFHRAQPGGFAESAPGRGERSLVVHRVDEECAG